MNATCKFPSLPSTNCFQHYLLLSDNLLILFKLRILLHRLVMDIYYQSKFNPPLDKLFRPTYLAGGGGVVPSINLNHCLTLTFCLLLSYRPILGLPEWKLNLWIFVKCTGAMVATPPSTIPLSYFRDKTVGPIWKFFWWTDAPRMRLQPKILFEIKALPIPEKNYKNLLGGGGGGVGGVGGLKL